MNHSEKLGLLLLKLENLQIRHESFEAEIRTLKEEIRSLQSPGSVSEVLSHPSPVEDHESRPVQPTVHYPPKQNEPVLANRNIPLPQAGQTPVFSQPEAPAQARFGDKFKRENLGKSDFEKFIGE